MEERKEGPCFGHLPAEHKDISKLKKDPSTKMSRKTSSEAPVIFEFSTEPATEMSPAEDIISKGRIIPLRPRSLSSFAHREKQPLSMSPLSPLHQAAKGDQDNNKPKTLSRRSESMPDFQRSLDSRKFGRSKSLMVFNCQNSAGKTLKRCETSSRNKANKPRWYNFMFGVGKIPQEMNLDDMKTRWLRRSPSTMFAQVNENGDIPRKQGSEKGTWTILRQAFSCKGPECAVDTSANCATRAA